ncbi:YihA family ribosome biogenesis GTP-binding protein [bacterium]|nr:YihA family ribosome biogenesis GTP-binding protein [bacterium]
MRIQSAEFIISAASPAQFPTTGLVEVAFAGRSNVGKSSLLNDLVGKRGLARTSNTPGRTQLINFFLINESFYFVDLPGYGYAKAPKELRQSWGRLIETYLRSRGQLRLLVLLIDCRHALSPLDRAMWEWIVAAGAPHQLVLTKTDKLSRSELVQQRRALAAALGVPPEVLIAYSTLKKEGRAELLAAIAARL